MPSALPLLSFLLLLSPYFITTSFAGTSASSPSPKRQLGGLLDTVATTTTAALAAVTGSASTLVTASSTLLASVASTTEIVTTAATTSLASAGAAVTTSYAETTSVLATETASATTEAASFATAGDALSASFASSTSILASSSILSLVASTTTSLSTASATLLTSLTTTGASYVSASTSSLSALASSVGGEVSAASASVTAAASVGLTTLGAAATGAVSSVTTLTSGLTGLTLPPLLCSAGESVCCQPPAPIANVFCIGPVWNLYENLVATAEVVTVERPLLVQGSALLAAVTMQISSPTYINGSFSMDSGSLISLTQVSGLDGPLLIIDGDASFLGTVAVTLDGRAPLRYPLIQVNGEGTFAGTFIITLGSIFTEQTPVVKAASINATYPISFLMVLHERPPFAQQKRDTETTIVMVFNASTSLSIDGSATVDVAPQFPLESCDTLSARRIESGNSMSVLVASSSTCKAKNPSFSARIGIAAAGGIIGLGVLSTGILLIVFRRRLCKHYLFQATEPDTEHSIK